jgi:acyl-coenzyme A thioesterase PaaI-like protein
MRNTPRKELIALAASNQERDAIARAVSQSTEGDFVSPRLLKGALEAAGYKVRETPRRVLTRVEVFKDDAQIMYAESGDAADALLQGTLAYLRSLPPQ